MGNHSKCFKCGELDEFCACPRVSTADAAIRDFQKSLAESQVPLDADIAQIIRDHASELYDADDTSPALTAALDQQTEPGQLVRCTPNLLLAGVDCGKTPRRPGDGTYSHDHFISHRSTPEPILQARSPEGDPWVNVTPEQHTQATKNGYETRILAVIPTIVTNNGDKT